MKHIWALFLMQLLVIAISTLKQLIIPEYHMGVYHKGGRNANDRTSKFDVSHIFDNIICVVYNPVMTTI